MTASSQFYQVLHRNPTVVYAKEPWQGEFAKYFDTMEPVAILAATNWKMHRSKRIKILKWYESHTKTYPNHRIELMLDRPDEVKFFREHKIPVTPFNPNALCDERVYRVLPRKKPYAASYIARPVILKRIDLCSKIKGTWLWLTYDVDKDPEIRDLTLGYPNVHAPQFKDGKYTGYIARHLIPHWLCQSRCSLALSREEGSNYASTEALLCGLPVVAAPGDCTRDQMFHPESVIESKPNRYSIADAVSMAHRLVQKTTPAGIRQITLEKIKPHRERFVEALQRAYRAVGITHDPDYDLYHTFRHQLLIWQPVDLVLHGGNDTNKELVETAKNEPRVRKLWGNTAGRFWENPIPVGVNDHV